MLYAQGFLACARGSEACARCFLACAPGEVADARAPVRDLEVSTALVIVRPIQIQTIGVRAWERVLGCRGGTLGRRWAERGRWAGVPEMPWKRHSPLTGHDCHCWNQNRSTQIHRISALTNPVACPRNHEGTVNMQFIGYGNKLTQRIFTCCAIFFGLILHDEGFSQVRYKYISTSKAKSCAQLSKLLNGSLKDPWGFSEPLSVDELENYKKNFSYANTPPGAEGPSAENMWQTLPSVTASAKEFRMNWVYGEYRDVGAYGTLVMRPFIATNIDLDNDGKKEWFVKYVFGDRPVDDKIGWLGGADAASIISENDFSAGRAWDFQDLNAHTITSAPHTSPLVAESKHLRPIIFGGRYFLLAYRNDKNIPREEMILLSAHKIQKQKTTFSLSCKFIMQPCKMGE